MKKILLVFLLLFIGWKNTTAQCFSDRHSTTWYESWVSCEESANPNTAYGNSHWILYNLGHEYPLYSSTLWNLNDTENLDNGILNYAIDYSIDGITWTNLGTFSANQASGLSTYEGEEGPNFSGATARYVLLTPISNYGGSCYGISEIRFAIDENLSVTSNSVNVLNATVFPNPFSEEFEVITYNSIIGESITYTIYDLLGRVIIKKEEIATYKINKVKFDMSTMQTGLYFVKVAQIEKEKTLKVIKE